VQETGAINRLQTRKPYSWIKGRDEDGEVDGSVWSERKEDNIDGREWDGR